jgi:hypothetical protein
MNFGFLAGLFEAIEQFLRQISHDCAAQIRIGTNEILYVRLFDNQQCAVVGTSG